MHKRLLLLLLLWVPHLLLLLLHEWVLLWVDDVGRGCVRSIYIRAGLNK